MAIETTYTQARERFASLCDEAADNQEVIIIHRRNAEDVALVSAAELRSLQETAHLMRSPRNAQRLLSALHRAAQGEGQTSSVEQLRKELDLETSADMLQSRA